MPRAVDIVATSPVLAHAISTELLAHDFKLGIRSYSWQDYSIRIDGSSTLLVLDAYLDDYVPLALKLRATRRMQTRTVIFGPVRGSHFEQRARAEGAVDWIPLTASLTEFGDRVAHAAKSRLGELPRRPGNRIDVDLSDRQLQMLAMYTSRRAGSRQSLALAMNISESTVAVHLRDGRARLSAAGFDVSSRTKLESVLVELGYAVPQEEWRAQRRW